MYLPPYDSPIEDDLAREIVKHLRPSVTWAPQFWVTTICGRFRLDFYLNSGGKKIGFECDGRDFHQKSWWKDLWRDQLILGSGSVDVIYRFRGCDIFHHLYDCIYLTSLWDPEGFTERGRLNLETLASFDVLGELNRGREEVVLHYRADEEDDDDTNAFENSDFRDGTRERSKFCIKVIRRDRVNASALFNYAKRRAGLRLDVIMDQFMRDYAPPTV